MEHVLPHDLEAEAAVLGACMVDPGVIPLVCTKLAAKSFYQRRHQAIFQAIKDAHEKNEAIDEITLRDKVEPEYKDLLFQLSSSVPSAANVHAYMATVRKHALARNAILACTEGLRNLEDCGMPDDVVSDVICKLEEARAGTHDRDPLSISQILMQPDAMTNERWDFNVGAIQDATRGVTPGGFVLVAGKEGAGKTTLCLQLIAEAAQKGQRIHIWSKDQPAVELAKITWAGVEGKTIEEVIAGAGENFERIGSLPIFFDQCEFTLDAVANSLRIEAARGTRWFLLDYLGLIDTPGHTFKADWERSVYAAKRIKVMAQDLKVFIFIIQEVIKSDTKRPKIQDIAGGRSLLHAADQVWWLEAPEVNPEDKKSHPTGFYVFKCRHFRPGYTELDFQGALHRFRSWGG